MIFDTPTGFFCFVGGRCRRRYTGGLPAPRRPSAPKSYTTGSEKSPTEPEQGAGIGRFRSRKPNGRNLPSLPQPPTISNTSTSANPKRPTFTRKFVSAGTKKALKALQVPKPPSSTQPPSQTAQPSQFAQPAQPSANYKPAHVAVTPVRRPAPSFSPDDDTPVRPSKR